MPRPFTLDTIGKLLDEGYELQAYCDTSRGCGRAQGPVDLVDLAARLGRDHPCGYQDLAPYLPCPDCLATLTIRLHPPAAPIAGGAHNLPRT
jgi:hypothetical protein